MFVVFRSLIACCAVFIFAACPAVAGSLITGIDLSELTSALRQQFSISESTHGVVILSVEAKSVFAEKNFHSGQLIIAVGATTTTTPNDVASAIAEQRKQGKLGVLFHLVEPSGEERYVAVPTNRISIPSLGPDLGPPLRETWPISIAVEALTPYLQAFDDFKATNPWIKIVVAQTIAALLVGCISLTLLFSLLLARRHMQSPWQSLQSTLHTVQTAATAPADATDPFSFRPQPWVPNPAAAHESLQLASAYLDEVSDQSIPDIERTRQLLNTLSIAGRHIAIAEHHDPGIQLTVEAEDQAPQTFSCNDVKVRALYLEGIVRSASQPRRAIRALKRSIAIEPTHASARYLMGIIYTQLFSRGRACAILHQAVMLEPDNMNFRKQLGRAAVISIFEILFDSFVKTINVTIKMVNWSVFLFMAALYTGLFYYLALIAVFGRQAPDTLIPLAVIWGLLILINFLPTLLERLQVWIKKQMAF